MAAHDESIENDLEQVEELLARGREGDGQRQRVYQQNADLVFRLLEHLTTHIRQTHATARQIEQLERSMTRLSQQATDQIEQATEVKTAYTATAHPPHRHRWTSNICPGCLRMIQPGEHITLIHIGPGDHPEERAKAAAKQPYTPVAMPAHWACVTGQEDS
jgi:hypothetical protein